MSLAPRPTMLFFGTPELAVHPLRKLFESNDYEIVGVVTQTDKPSGRGNKLTPTPVKEYALANGLRVFQPKSIKLSRSADGQLAGANDDGLADFLNTRPIDVFVVAAYGKIIPASLLDTPRAGIINVHYSLLPHLRGAAPIQRAILAGDQETGVSIMRIDEGLDSGPVYATEKVSILPTDTCGTLTEKLNDIGSALLLRVLPDILSGKREPVPQPQAGITYAEKLQKEDFEIQWNNSAESIERLIRASSPTPGARSKLGPDFIKIYAAHSSPNLNYAPAAAGSIVELNKSELIVATGKGGYISIDEMQLPGRKRLPIGEILRGRGVEPGMKFS